MSYILEALEKAEKKRRTGTVPDLQTVHEVAGLGRKPGRRWWPALVAGLLVAQTLAVLWWLRPWQAENDAEGQRPVTATEETTATKPAAPRLAEAPTSASPTAPNTAITKGAAVAGPPAMNQPSVSETALPPGNAKATPAPSDQNPNTTVAAASESAPPLPANQETATAGEGQTTAEPPPADLVIEEPLGDLPTAAQPDPEKNSPARNRPAPAADKAAAAAIPSISQLPASIRNSLPEMTVSYHAYTNNPASRLVSINGHVVRQGQSITKDLVLEEITPSGVIIRNNEQRFRIEVY